MERAFERATRALETALRLGVKGTFPFAELGIHPAVAEDREVGEQMLARYVEPLLKNQGGATVLTTVQHFLANDRNVDLTASELGVHPNTVRQRLERFEEATGRSTRDTETLVELWWALERHRLG
jgi:DNA-binding PucR family transcriptional regulator